MELNPDHPKTKEMHDLWHKICALIMHKFGKDKVTITPQDAFLFMKRCEAAEGGSMAIVSKRDGDNETLMLVSIAEGRRLARKEAERN